MLSPHQLRKLRFGKIRRRERYYCYRALGHEFEFEKVFTKAGHLSIEPKVELTAGTQNFLSTYYIRKNNSAPKRQNASTKGKGKTSSSTSTSTTTTSSNATSVTSNTNKFQTLAYEFTLPVGYSWKKLGFSFTLPMQ